MRIRAFVLTGVMVAAAATAIALTPKQLYAPGQKPETSLEELVPKSFGEWYLDPATSQQIVNPTVLASLARFYTDNLSRTYVNNKGERVMLSLAYGADQSRAMQVHKPEVCYVGQGFVIDTPAKGNTLVGGGKLDIPNMRLVAKLGARNEPITYWIRSGDYVVRGWFEQNVARVKNGLIKGYTPDGLLVRVSTIGADKEQAYKLQDRFMADLIAASPAKTRAMLLGNEADLVKQ
jgi:EpsI family protein